MKQRLYLLAITCLVFVSCDTPPPLNPAATLDAAVAATFAARPTSTSTETPTPTHTPTVTFSPTPTSSPTSTFTPSPTPIPIGFLKANLPIYAGIATYTEIVTTTTKSITATIWGISPDGNWYLVKMLPTLQGWVMTDTLSLAVADVSIPVVEITPPPSPTPTPENSVYGETCDICNYDSYKDKMKGKGGRLCARFVRFYNLQPREKVVLRLFENGDKLVYEAPRNANYEGITSTLFWYEVNVRYDTLYLITVTGDQGSSFYMYFRTSNKKDVNYNC